jgi:acyl phosphate:glycerol-3-phosphate acyltransferase
MQILSLAMAYFIGAVPFAYLVVRLTQGIDIRQVGSGNVGATNALRSAGKGWGILTLLLDAGKGFVAVILVRYLTQSPEWGLLGALAAILGHVFPVFLRFRGGKGVSTACGAFLAVAPGVVGICALAFLAATALSRYVSLGSILAAACFPLAAWLRGEAFPVVAVGGAAGVLIIAKHAGNIRRLLEGTERKLSLKK